MSAVDVRLPRISDVPAEADHFRCEILEKYQRRSATQQRFVVRLYLEDFPAATSSPCSAPWWGKTAALAPTSIVRMKEEWA